MNRHEGEPGQARARRTPDATSWQPLLLDATNPADQWRLQDLLQRRPTIVCVDTIDAQLHDYARTLLKDKRVGEGVVAAKVRALLDGHDSAEIGAWVYYPWRDQVAHVLPKAMFRELRLDRNQHKITRGQQSVLLEKCIGVVGLSVGSSALMTLVLEGVGSKFRIADFDVLDLSNLNRLRGSVLDVGVNKAILAARAVLEIDPYLEVELFAEGINTDNLGRFFAPGLDLLVEECDDLPMKVRLREHARAAGIPVLMETTDRGMLDIERFDLEPERPILHGRIGEVDAESLQHASNRDRVPFVLSILDEERISTRLAASLLEIEKTIYTWPQLASAVALGGALVSHSARNLLLGLHTFSGRLYVDLDKLLSEEVLYRDPIAPVATDIAAVDEPRECPPLPPRGDAELTASAAKFLIMHAICAPSGGNSQPWQFAYRAGHIDCHLVAERSDTFLDFQGWASHLAVGAAMENICIAASCLGYQTVVAEGRRKEGPLARLRFVEHEPKTDHHGDNTLRHAIFTRVTNRRKLPQAPLDADSTNDLVTEATRLGLHLLLVRDASVANDVGRVLGAADRLRCQIRGYHEELIRELRWNTSEAHRDRTGIDVATLEATEADLAGLRVLRRWDVMQFLEREGLGESLEDEARKAVAACAGIGLLSAPSAMGPIEGGRALQRLWLHATCKGLAWQPWAPLLAMYARAKTGDGLSSKEQRLLVGLGERLLGLWNPPQNHSPLFIFRVLKAPLAPSRRSLRLPLDKVFADASKS